MDFVGILFWLAGLLVGLFITKVLSDPIEQLIVWTPFLGKKRSRNLTGNWKVIYSGSAISKPEIETLRIKHLGGSVRGRTFGNSKRRYKIVASFSLASVITGTWQSELDQNQSEGTFQLIVHPNGMKANGKWLGFDDNNNIRSGDWEWQRLE